MHTQSRYYAERYGTVKIEDLKISNMTGTARGTADAPGSQVRQKAGLNRAILDSGWGLFDLSLKYKMEERGGTLLKFAPHYTSQTCPVCGYVDVANRTSQSLFICKECGHEGNADVIAACNLHDKSSSVAVSAKARKKVFRRGRKTTAVKPTVKQPAEVT